MNDQYYANGQKAFEQKGNIRTYFFKTGKLRAKGKFINGSMEGKWIFNRVTGELWQIGHFLQNEKHGEWIRYDKKGTVEYHAEFVDGKLIKKIK